MISNSRDSNQTVLDNNDQQKTDYELHTEGKICYLQLSCFYCSGWWCMNAGDSGPTGRPGPPGGKGDTGGRGARGRTGREGAKGDRGDPGSPGRTGRKGESGGPGQPGVPGKTEFCHCVLCVCVLWTMLPEVKRLIG